MSSQSLPRGAVKITINRARKCRDMSCRSKGGQQTSCPIHHSIHPSYDYYYYYYSILHTPCTDKELWRVKPCWQEGWVRILCLNSGARATHQPVSPA